MCIKSSNALLVFHRDEDDNSAGSGPLTPGGDGINGACRYDRSTLGEVTNDLPLLLRQQGVYDFGMLGGTGATPGTPRSGFTNADLPYAIDFDTAPGFWLKGHPTNGGAAIRKMEGARTTVTSPTPLKGTTEPLFPFLV